MTPKVNQYPVVVMKMEFYEIGAGVAEARFWQVNVGHRGTGVEVRFIGV